jgi:hypothetical protein
MQASDNLNTWHPQTGVIWARLEDRLIDLLANLVWLG